MFRRMLSICTIQRGALWLWVLLLSLPAWALKPDRIYQQTPDSLGMTYAARTVSTADGYSLNTWTIKPAAGKERHVTVVLAYQDFGNMSYYLHQMNALRKAGYDVVAFDYRGFGKSADFPLDARQLYYAEFAEDLRTVVKASRQQFPTQKVGVLALSMGTIAAATVAAEGKLDFLVGEGFVTNPQEFVDRVKQAKNKEILLPAQAVAYPKLLPSITCPVLVFAGSQDAFTTLADARQFVGQHQRRQSLEFAGGHLGGFAAFTSKPDDYAVFGDKYVDAITHFLAAVTTSAR